MGKKALAGWALLFILSLALAPLVAVRGPSYVAWTSTEGLPSKTEGQTTREGEGSRTQEETAGGKGNGQNDTGIQSGPTKPLTGTTDLFSGEAADPNPIIVTEDGKRMDGPAESAHKKPTDSTRRVSRGASHTNSGLGTFVITAYTAGKESTGKSPGDKDYGVTATGTTALAGRTIAADWEVLPPTQERNRIRMGAID